MRHPFITYVRHADGHVSRGKSFHETPTDAMEYALAWVARDLDGASVVSVLAEGTDLDARVDALVADVLAVAHYMLMDRFKEELRTTDVQAEAAALVAEMRGSVTDTVRTFVIDHVAWHEAPRPTKDALAMPPRLGIVR